MVSERKLLEDITTEVRLDTDERARIVVLAGTEAGRIHRVEEHVLIGRGAEADVQLPSPGVSRRHARILRLPTGRYVIEDLGSRNGTTVNGLTVDRQTLEFGDRIYVGGEVALLFTRHHSVEDEMAQLQKLQAVGQLTAGVAHDFNNLLSVVVSSLDYITSAPEEAELTDEDISECVTDAKAASKRAAELASQLLGFARPGRASSEIIDVAALVGEATRLSRRTFDPSIHVEADMPRNLYVRGDRVALLQVLMNLCINARDAMADGGGTLTVGAAPVDASEAAKVGALPHVKVWVSDTGAGMDEPTLRRVFEPFFTTKRSGRGSGLGLATAQGIVRAQGGSLDVSSRPGQGSTFTVYLRRAEAERIVLPTMDLRAALLQTNATAARHRPARVLLVDDERLLLRSASRQLRRRGFEILTASSGHEALEMYRQQAKDIDVVLLDMGMPDLSGEAAFVELQDMDPDVRVVFFSGYWDEERTTRMLERGARGFVQKPWEAEELERALAAALAEDDSGAAAAG